MATKKIALQRLYNQRLEGPQFQKPEEVVAWMGAVQGQEYALAKWALALRMTNATDAMVEQAFDAGRILRTHIMRPTWHFVTPGDIRWLLDLTASRVHQVNGTMYRKLELDDMLLRRCAEVIAEALHGGKTLTRAELGDALTAMGVDTSDGMRLAYIVMYAELEGIICSGPRRGNQHTYNLLDERAPNAKRLSPEEALAELTLRFFTSHGPATVKDFAWWSGLKISDVNAGLAMLDAQLTLEEIEGETYYFADSSDAEPLLRGHLLPVYDEYTVTYKKASSILDPLFAEQIVQNPLFTSTFALNGELIGMWRRTFERGSVVIESAPFRPYSDAEQAAFEAAAQRFGDFLGMPVELR